MLATKEICSKEPVLAKLNDMGLDQIANWVRILPEDRWENMFIMNWPALARKCGIRN